MTSEASTPTITPSDRETTCPHCLRKLKWKQNLPRHLQTCPVYKTLSTTSAKADGSSGDGRTTSMIDSMHFSPSVGQTMTPGDELRTILHESTPCHNESLLHVLNQRDMDKVEVRQSLLLPSAKNTKAWHTINAQLKIHLTQHFPTSYLKSTNIEETLDKLENFIHWFFDQKPPPPPPKHKNANKNRAVEKLRAHRRDLKRQFRKIKTRTKYLQRSEMSIFQLENKSSVF